MFRQAFSGRAPRAQIGDFHPEKNLMTMLKWPVIGLAGAIFCAGAMPSQAQIVPCSQRSDPAERDRNSPEGIACRKSNIDAYIGALNITQPVKSSALRTCLRDLGRELEGTRGRNGVAGAGRKYFEQVKKCQVLAQKAGDSLPTFSVDSATDNGSGGGDGGGGDCDADCVAKELARFMQGNPEP